MRDNFPDIGGVASGVAAIAAGGSHTCALTNAGAVKCWGRNSYGQLGDNSTTQRIVPTDVFGLTSGVTAIALGGNHTCALTSAGAVKCWGANHLGQLGDGSTTQRTVPTDVSGLSSGITAITAGDIHTCALAIGGAVKCWGHNVYGQLGDNSTTQRNVPTDVPDLTAGVTALTAGDLHTCALTSAGAVKCWGYNGTGQLGDNSTANSTVPTDVFGLTSGVLFVAPAFSHTCAVTISGQAKCWGNNSYGQLGSSSVPNGLDILDVFGLTEIQRVEMVFGM